MVTVKVGKAKDGAIPFGTAQVKETVEVSRPKPSDGSGAVAEEAEAEAEADGWPEQVLVDQSNYPVYIHDLDGSDVLAIMCAALRKLQGWSEQAWTTEMSRQVT